MKTPLIIGLMAGFMLYGAVAENGITKWFGPELKLVDDQVVVFEDGFARCYALRDVTHNYNEGSSHIGSVTMSCVPLKGNK